jgi:phosphatidylglycerophosphatase A
MKIEDLKNPYILLSSGFGLGLIPLAPGTMGSGFGLCLYIYIAHFHLPTFIIYLSLMALLFIAWIAVNKTLKQLGEGDHKEIVIDEIIGMMFVATVLPADPYWAIAAFLLFRFFDIVKPFPINKVDRAYKNAFGIILDDLIASGYSIALILIGRELLG